MAPASDPAQRDSATSGDDQAVRERVRRIVRGMAAVPVEELRADTKLVDDLGYDSLRLLELAIALEVEFELTGVTSDDAVSITTVGGVEDFAVRLLAERE